MSEIKYAYLKGQTWLYRRNYPKLSGQFDHVGNQLILICTPLGHTPLGRTMLPQHSTGSALRHFEPVADMVDTGTTTSGAQ